MTSIRTSKSSILKNFVSTSRDQVKNAVASRVRFELLTNLRLREILKSVEDDEPNSKRDYNQYLYMIQDKNISEKDFIFAIQESKECIDRLIKYDDLAKALMSLDWTRHKAETVKVYQSFLIDLLSSHNKFVRTAVDKLVAILVPRDADQNPCGIEEEQERNRCVISTLKEILEIVPLSVNTIIKACVENFPFYSTRPVIYAGYFRTMIEVIRRIPELKKELLSRIVAKLIILDANTPRQDIDEAENESDDEELFDMEMENDTERNQILPSDDQMKHPQAESLDLCMNELFEYVKHEYSLESKHRNGTNHGNNKTFDILIEIFETLLLPAHNTHHVQFVIFYFCSFDNSFAESFTNICWQKLNRLNCPNPIRQASIGYLASMLTRSMYSTIDVLKNYLHEMCNWIRDYIQRCDSGQNSFTLKAHAVFFAACQAVFYIISFRSRDLTSSNQNLLFLESLQLNTIVMSNLNPLRYCLPAVATAFSGVTRAHQLAYCHTVLERNARRKLATIYSNDQHASEEVLETFFPFDQYMLKRSGKRITAIYREYQSSEAEDEHVHESEDRLQKRRKCMESGSFVEDMEDFIVQDKQRRVAELSKSFDRDLQIHNINLTPKK